MARPSSCSQFAFIRPLLPRFILRLKGCVACLLKTIIISTMEITTICGNYTNVGTQTQGGLLSDSISSVNFTDSSSMCVADCRCQRYFRLTTGRFGTLLGGSVPASLGWTPTNLRAFGLSCLSISLRWVYEVYSRLGSRTMGLIGVGGELISLINFVNYLFSLSWT